MKFGAKRGTALAFRPAIRTGFASIAVLTAAAGCLLNNSGNAPVASQSTQPQQPTTVAFAATRPAVSDALTQFHSTVQPILQERCFACHSGADNHTGIAFDTLITDESITNNPELWLKVLKNTRSHVMPPVGEDPPTTDQQLALEKWIKYSAFGVDPNNLDPGRQTIRRLNRAEYHNTIQDLMGVDFDVETNFPADDIGYGFDNIGDVLNVSPMLMEKYVQAAQNIVAQAVPLSPKTMPVQIVNGSKFPDGAKVFNPRNQGSTDLSYFTDAKVTHTFDVPIEGDYKIVMDHNIKGAFNFIPARCTITYTADQTELSKTEGIWHDDASGTDELNVHWTAGKHTFSVAIHPTTPKPANAGALTFRILKVQLQGPADQASWNDTPGYARFFPHGPAPKNAAKRREYAREIIRNFTFKAFRRPVPDQTIDRLTDIAQGIYSAPDGTFEKGISQAMVAALASPRFIYRVESVQQVDPGFSFVQVDEYSLASRLSYFLWSTMPDDELLNLAASHQLRKNLQAEVTRMLADPRSQALVENFTGQWLQSREAGSVPINPHEVLLREGITTPPSNNSMPGPVRAAMQQEPQAYFAYIMHGDRSVNEFLDSDYTFLNQALADFYKIPGVTGPNMQKVTVAPDSLRGGALTMGATLMVTSNPTRTSPVKRGKWVLENILGAPTPPPPPDIPPLELAANQIKDSKKPTLRQILATHRASPVCASCHDRMDPLGLSMENFNAEGVYRKKELDQPIDASGQLFTGEKFNNIGDLKHALVQNHLMEFYRCLTEKLLTYATGRGMEYYDVPTIDKIADELQHENGRFSVLLLGVIDSAPFQEQRVVKQSELAQATP